MSSVADRQGICYWFTGLSGAGKTAIAQEFTRRLIKLDRSAIFFDGDIIRAILGDLSPSHSIEDRLLLAQMYGRLCQHLVGQGFDVVCATISMFADVYQWNRANIPGYREIYVRMPIEALIARDKNGIYSRALRGELRNVVGIDIQPTEPPQPDLIVENDGTTPVSRLVDFAVENLLVMTGISPASGGE